ncbi:hypothetical protein M7806_24855 [Enterobacter hormaechei subsp. xiangfangensis]|nr:hypothetical protein [Enterobacter hormaechei]MCW4948759.1 hypothetical protein [Enterobacter hormaechei subsp. xiangfangensis]
MPEVIKKVRISSLAWYGYWEEVSQHVSIVYPAKPSGLLRTVFVSVDDAGGVNRTYGDQSPVDFSAIKDDLYVPSDL